MRTIIIIQARMTSSRLPGKVLKTVLGKPLLAYQIERLRQSKRADGLLVATTEHDTDLPIVALCQQLGVPVFRGSEEDVLARYYGAAQQEHADVVVRVTSDCPLIDPEVVDQTIACFLERYPEVAYVSNVQPRTYPRGMDTEVIAFPALAAAHLEAIEPQDREHVTPFIYHQPDRFATASTTFERDESRHRWTVDTAEDFTLIERILTTLYPRRADFDLQDCLALMAEHPTWGSLNAHIEQKAHGR